MIQVLHGLRRFGTAERGWHLRVEGQCPDVVAFAVMIKPPGREPVLTSDETRQTFPVVVYKREHFFVKMLIMVHFCQYLGIYR